jgi:hypothetical protein
MDETSSWRSSTSRSLQSICKYMDFMIRFRHEASDGEDHGCEGYFGKEAWRGQAGHHSGTQGDFGYAVPNGGDLDRRGRFYSE